MERILKVFVEEQDNGKFSLREKNGNAKVKNLSKRQIEEIYSFLKELGFDVFLYGKREVLAGLKISEQAKVPVDDVFKTFRKLQPWEVWE